MSARGCLESTTEWETTSGGLSIRAHRISCPLDHFAQPVATSSVEELDAAGERRISIFVREVVDSAYANDSGAALERLESLVYLQGGPGHECTREGIGATPWIVSAARSHKFRVFLMDQRGTGFGVGLTLALLQVDGFTD